MKWHGRTEIEMVPKRTKPPKMRFHPGDKFKYDGGEWQIILIYRLASEPHVWRHVLEEIKPMRGNTPAIAAMMIGSSLCDQSGKVVVDPVRDHYDAIKHVRDRFAMGDQMTKTTQQLLALPRLE